MPHILSPISTFGAAVNGHGRPVRRDWLFIATPTATGHPPTVADCVAAVSKHYGIGKNLICAARRDFRSTLARHVTFYLAYKMTDRSLPTIGRAVGGRDHTTVMSGRDRIANLIAVNAGFEAEIAQIEQTILVTHFAKADASPIFAAYPGAVPPSRCKSDSLAVNPR